MFTLFGMYSFDIYFTAFEGGRGGGGRREGILLASNQTELRLIGCIVFLSITSDPDLTRPKRLEL